MENVFDRQDGKIRLATTDEYTRQTGGEKTQRQSEIEIQLFKN